jgi:hypothetical protein
MPTPQPLGQPPDQMCRAGLSGPIHAICSKPVASGLHRDGQQEHHQEHRINARDTRDQERSGLKAETFQRLHDHQAAQDEEHVHPGAAVLEHPMQPSGHRHKRKGVAEHDVARQHPTQPIQAYHPLHGGQHRRVDLTSRQGAVGGGAGGLPQGRPPVAE